MNLWLLGAGGGGREKGTVREFGMDMYTALYLEWITNRDLLYSTGTLLSVMWQPGWEGSLGEHWGVCVRVCPYVCYIRVCAYMCASVYVLCVCVCLCLYVCWIWLCTYYLCGRVCPGDVCVCTWTSMPCELTGGLDTKKPCI